MNCSPRTLLAGKDRREGSTVVLVLFVLAVAMTASYTVIRSQASTTHVQRNSAYRSQAKQAALAGLRQALDKIQQPEWCENNGVDTLLEEHISPYDRFRVTFTTGDTTLIASNPDFVLRPYRVTIESVGYSANPLDPAVESTHHVEAVVQLVAQATGTHPPGWSSMLEHTVYQHNSDEFRVELPSQIRGSVFIQGALNLATSESIGSGYRDRYLKDLGKMSKAPNRSDWRPLTGPVYLAASNNPNHSELPNLLQVTAIPLSANDLPSGSPFGSRPSEVLTYRLYPGGREYQAQLLSSFVINQTLKANVADNPLGIFYRNGNVDVADNTTIEGTIVCRDRLRLVGSNITIAPAPLPRLDLPWGRVRLPSIVTRNLRLDAPCFADIRGVVLIHNHFELEPGPHSAAGVEMRTRMITGRMRIRERDGWKYGWSPSLLPLFSMQNALLTFPTLLEPKYLPEHVSHWRPPMPVLTIRPLSTEVGEMPIRDHWQELSQPLYVPSADAPDHPPGGLKWELVRWTDSPNKE